MPRLESDYSTQVSAMAGDFVSPSQVTGLAYSVTQGKVTLTWDAVTTNTDASAITDLAGYHIYRKKNVGDSYGASIGTVASGVTTFDDTTMKDGASYVYAVAAFDTYDPANEGALSNNLAVKTIPSIPTGVNTAAVIDKVTINWTSVQTEDVELNENLAGYAVYRSTVSGSGYVNVGEVASGIVTFDDTTVTNGTTYYYVVTAFDDSL